MEGTALKRNYTRLEFTQEEEEMLINHVKSNPGMFNPKDSQYKNRARSFDRFGATIQKSGIFLMIDDLFVIYVSVFLPQCDFGPSQ